jgi:hypothetical protein
MMGPGRSGVAMILVILLIGLVGITLGYLGHSCRLMLVQTDLQYQRAVDRNLVMSGLAWAKLRTQNTERRTQNEVTLDVNELGRAGLRLGVTVADGNDGPMLVHVTTFVPSARYDLSRSRTFQVTRR